jgi:hypothetical protein
MTLWNEPSRKEPIFKISPVLTAAVLSFMVVLATGGNTAASRRFELNQRLLGVKIYRHEAPAYSSVSASQRLYALAIQCIRL